MSDAMDDFDAAVDGLLEIDEKLAVATLSVALVHAANLFSKRVGRDESEDLKIKVGDRVAVTVHADRKSP